VFFDVLQLDMRLTFLFFTTICFCGDLDILHLLDETNLEVELDSLQKISLVPLMMII